MRIGVTANRLVLVNGDTAVDIELASNGLFPADPTQLFDMWDPLVEWANTAEPRGESVPLDQLQNPVSAPRQVFGIGANYRDHIAEAANHAGGRDPNDHPSAHPER
jgi:2-keto-4-pentenoate hydratase/2-oxohepta-3-ene-1,7-dioic acid hydratase in catechol pathway